MIVDFHVHPFRTEAYSLCMYPGRFPANPVEMKRQLQQAGIGHICGSVLSRGFTLDGFESLRRLNREALALQELLGDFYTPGFHIHPAYVRESIEEIEEMHRRGLRLMGELVPYMHGWTDFAEKDLFAILEAADECGMVCSFHTPFDYDYRRMAARFPRMRFVAAHPGDPARALEHIAIMREYPNLYLDISGTGLHRFGLLRALVGSVGAERVLFGTDYPICNPRMYVQAVVGEELPEQDRELILHGNAERLLGITP